MSTRTSDLRWGGAWRIGHAAVVVALVLAWISQIPITAGASTRLFRVVRSLSLPATPSNLVAASRSALYLSGKFSGRTDGHIDNLMRVTEKSLSPAAVTYVPGPTGFAFGLGSLWVTAGDVVRLDPTSLAVTARFALPEQALMVSVAKGTLWVTTRTSLLAVNPSTGAVVHTKAVGFLAYAMAPSPNGKILYVVGDKQGVSTPAAVLASFDTTTGARISERVVGPATTGPIAATKRGAWVPVSELGTNSSTLEFYRGQRLLPGPRIAHQGPAVAPYVAASALWLIDGSGASRTKCANAITGHIYATGPPISLSLSGAMLPADGRAFLERHAPFRNSLAEIEPTSACKS